MFRKTHGIISHKQRAAVMIGRYEARWSKRHLKTRGRQAAKYKGFINGVWQHPNRHIGSSNSDHVFSFNLERIPSIQKER
jgi:hypothetical protein